MNKDEEDYLTEDPEISSQKVVLLSFLSPEKILAQKDLFLFTKFLNDYHLQWKTSKLEAWMGQQLQAINTRLETLAGSLEKMDLSGASVEVRNSLLRVDRVVEDFQQYTRKNMAELTSSEMKKEYDDFLFKNSSSLEEEFFKLNNFTTTMRGIKVRGVFASEAEASVRAKRLQKSDPSFNIYMGAVGKWMAWEPDPNNVKEQEYANDELNTLMKKYRENEEAKDTFYTEQKNRKVSSMKTRSTEEAESVAGVASVASVSGVVEGSASASASASANAGNDVSVTLQKEETSSYDGLFSGPADLAIQRKMAAEKKE